MTKYVVDFSYIAPLWGSIELDAIDKEDAEGQAKAEIGRNYPEALDVTIDEVRVLENA